MIDTMIKQMPKYESYKESGIEWLGEIPSTWQLRRFKYLLDEVNERSDSGTEELLSVSQYTGVTRKSDKVQSGELLTNAASLEGYKMVRKGDLVSNIMLAWNGSLGVSPFNGITSPAYSVYRFESQCSEGYFHYLLRTGPYKAEFKRRSTGVIESRLRLYSDDFFDVVGMLPSYDEQVAIATFLDVKTSQIDEAIAIKQKQIELLKEHKQITIQKAVTQGLNPDAPMKDSGSDWIGEIPEHWDIGKAKYYSSVFVPERAKPNLNESSDGFPWVTTENLRSISPTTSKSKYYVSFKDAQATGSRAVDKNSVLATCVGTFGIAAINEESCIINQQIQAYTRLNINTKYLLKLIELSKDYFSINATMTTIAYVNRDIFADLPIIIPPNSEQEEIAHYIDIKESQIEQLIDLQKLQIDKLKEYKATLINSAVTGKIKVTELV